MILLLGQHHDTSTDKVCNWLNYYEAKFVRTNSGTNNYDIISNITFSDSNLSIDFNIDGKIYNMNEFHSIWCRRGHISFRLPHRNAININENNIAKEIREHLINENSTLEVFINYLIEQKFHVNKPDHYNSNKLIALKIAQNVGLKTPKTLITQSNTVFEAFNNLHKECITKNIQDNLSYHDNNYTFGHSTLSINTKDIITETFLYSLFQNNIDKKYELRIFYLLGDFYTSAAIPPHKTNSTDIRTTNKTNRHVPFNLPTKIKEKLTDFMHKMQLESGSIDIIVDNNDNYIFLEVNSVGQFDFLSGKNNFHIEKEIAKKLINGK